MGGVSATSLAAVGMDRLLSPTAAPVVVAAPFDWTASAHTQITLPISVTLDVTGLDILAYQFELTYDPTVLRAVAVNRTATLSAAWTVIDNHTVAGQWGVVGYNAAPLAGNGVLLNLVFDVIGAEGAETALNFTGFRFNEGIPTVQINAGSLHILTAPPPTNTPSATPPSTLTATATPSPTHSPTSTPTASPTSTFAVTPTPTVTATPLAIAILQPETGGNVTAQIAGLGAEFTFPPNAVHETTRIVVVQTDGHPLPSSLALLGSMFALQAYTGNGQPLLSFAQSYTLTIQYLISQRNATSARKMQTTPPQLLVWTATATDWAMAPTTVDPINHKLSATFKQPVTLAVVIPQTAPTYQIFLAMIRR